VARVLEMFQIGVVQGNLTLSVGAISYAGQLNLGIVADSVAVPDVLAFAEGVTDTLGQLGALVTADREPPLRPEVRDDRHRD
jgi:diacylglycerol O-acyltransferase / wax synthase